MNMSVSSNSSRRQPNNNVANHNDAGCNLVDAPKSLGAAEAGISSARRSDDSDDELQVPSKFRKTMLSSSISPKTSSSSGAPLSSSMASIKLSIPDPEKVTSENVPVASSSNDEQTSKHFSSGESRASLPMDMETALSILLLPEESASNDENHEYITHSKDEYITFRRANPSDAPTLGTFIHKSQRKLKMQIHQQNNEQKNRKLVENALDSKTCAHKVNNTLDSESLDPLDDVAALEMRLLSGLGCNSFGEDDSPCGGDVSHTNPPSIFSILAERHYCRSIKLERCEKHEANEQLHGLVGAALFFIRWDATNSCRYLDVTYLHVDTQCGELSDSKSSSDILSIHQEKNDIIWRRMMLRLTTLCLATDCQSLHFTSVGRTHPTKSDARKSKLSQNCDKLS